MSEWLSYSLADFLLFSPQTYFRQFALINEETSPLAIVFAALALTLAIFGGGRRWNFRVSSIGLALLWAAPAWLFHHESYAEINWAANWFAIGFGVQAALLTSLRLAGGFSPSDTTRRVSLVRVLAVLVVLLYPLQAVIFGRPWQEAEIVGISPDATAVFTLFILALGAGRMRYLFAAIPVWWIVISLLSLWTMGASEFWTLAVWFAVSIIAFNGVADRTPRSGQAPAG